MAFINPFTTLSQLKENSNIGFDEHDRFFYGLIAVGAAVVITVASIAGINHLEQKIRQQPISVLQDQKYSTSVGITNEYKGTELIYHLKQGDYVIRRDENCPILLKIPKQTKR